MRLIYLFYAFLFGLLFYGFYLVYKMIFKGTLAGWAQAGQQALEAQPGYTIPPPGSLQAGLL